MFKLFSGKKERFDFNLLYADMHSHLLPGIDDGSPDTVTSLRLVKGMGELGYKKLITTPHIYWNLFKNTNEIILSKFGELKNALKLADIQVEIHVAAEYFLDDHVADLLNKKIPLLTISGNMVLVELSMAHPTLGFKDILFEMTMQGYQPVLAHPERYIYPGYDKKFFDELKTAGCFFQLNLLSLGNSYGKAVTALAEYLIKKEYYELIGTDLHNIHHLNALQNFSAPDALQKLLHSGKIMNDRL